MDFELRRLMRLNEKKRQINDGLNIDLEEFPIFEVMEDPGEILDVVPIDYSRKGDEGGLQGR